MPLADIGFIKAAGFSQTLVRALSFATTSPGRATRSPSSLHLPAGAAQCATSAVGGAHQVVLLLRTFPGRFEGGSLRVGAEAPRDSDQGRQARRVDGVNSILITSNDFASAWAVDDNGRPIYPIVSGRSGKNSPEPTKPTRVRLRPVSSFTAMHRGRV